ncbi:hypothetical protein EPA93_29550 [Ktedonosporobacter rubrisoli]|uniref:DUF4097 domain-containing protein n=1 Tax=Ktedonosporobacter rubrisoli TaxID=2509675 RepID=A0A4P6JWX0_KTERU|nr:DUF4097 family beta strand repeat-containing protein [Ktedonosporobacter rubrisoli]QBD79902.1 hypothetical protein EPA93_29550 [Ktedonosporobacter rubrisoli]
MGIERNDRKERVDEREYRFEQRQSGYDYDYPLPRQRKSIFRRLWLPICIVVLLLGIWSVAQNGLIVKHSELPVRSFTLANHGTLRFDGGAGNLRIHGEPGNSIVVHATSNVIGLQAPEITEAQVSYSQDGNAVAIRSQDSSGLLGVRYIDFDITVPTALDMDLEVGSGNIDISNLKGNLAIKTGSGNLQARAINGQDAFSSGSGNIVVEQGQVSGRTMLKSGSGNIRLDAALDPSGSYELSTGSGNITLALPANSSFHLNASTDSGNLNNAFGSTDVGQGTRAALSVDSGSGNIILQRR